MEYKVKAGVSNLVSLHIQIKDRGAGSVDKELPCKPENQQSDPRTHGIPRWVWHPALCNSGSGEVEPGDSEQAE